MFKCNYYYLPTLLDKEPELQINIPDNIEIISINDNDISKFVSPPLTTFRIEAEEIAKTTIDMLVDQIVYNRKTTKTVLLNSELMIRKSFVPKT
ncbi:substrate-binding domain-containing protein [Globicatella sanguinis]